MVHLSRRPGRLPTRRPATGIPPAGRAALVRRGDAQARALADELSRDSPEFAELWSEHDVAVLRSRRKRMRHPETGLLELDCQALLEETRSQILALFVPAPGTDTADRLALLGVLRAARTSEVSSPIADHRLGGHGDRRPGGRSR
ncbi:hypothetical protein AB0K15_47275 [Amycolatopsis sp. NPDC049253]|uniref:MmyB family transcriptional regulator n=1 Tax=Amycolatopsis sp. NPDC049253 TaxID=3155274 RepID=UPI003436AB1B